jgi:hypothetical protein
MDSAMTENDTQYGTGTCGEFIRLQERQRSGRSAQRHFKPIARKNNTAHSEDRLDIRVMGSSW